jgi:hypothetical protein
MLRQYRITIFTSLTLFNPDHHPGWVAFDMFWLEADCFPDSEPSAVNGLEQNSMLEVIDAIKEPADFFHGQYCR